MRLIGLDRIKSKAYGVRRSGHEHTWRESGKPSEEFINSGIHADSVWSIWPDKCHEQATIREHPKFGCIAAYYVRHVFRSSTCCAGGFNSRPPSAVKRIHGPLLNSYASARALLANPVGILRGLGITFDRESGDRLVRRLLR